MKLGAFSVSLSVKDIAKSRAFYEALGFEAVGGDMAQNWLVLRNDGHTIGLFQGMFEGNILTFNPGWGPNATALDSFEDVRAIQKSLQDKGIELAETADPASDGPAHFTMVDPDGNSILIDQHVPKPADA